MLESLLLGWATLRGQAAFLEWEWVPGDGMDCGGRGRVSMHPCSLLPSVGLGLCNVRVLHRDGDRQSWQMEPETWGGYSSREAPD